MKIKINSRDIWLTFDNIRYYDNNEVLLEKKDMNICYFSVTKPKLIPGEIFRDEDNNVMCFKTREEAKEYAILELQRRFNKIWK